MQQEHFILDNFEGTIDFLLNLIQKEELPIHEVDVRRLTGQFLERLESEKGPAIDAGAEFVGAAAFLIWFKSKTLLPQHEQSENPEENESDPRFAIIHQLLDYCRFKEAAKALEEREVRQSAFYLRGSEGHETKMNLGIESLSLEDLASLFKTILAKAEKEKGTIAEEEWKVSDKVAFISRQLEQQPQIAFEQLFHAAMSRLELIVTFLALLELMKRGALRVVRGEGGVVITGCN